MAMHSSPLFEAIIDKVWRIGVSLQNLTSLPPKEFIGRNVLGQFTMRLRNEIRKGGHASEAGITEVDKTMSIFRAKFEEIGFGKFVVFSVWK
jgi:hypothetical protein